MRILFLSQYCSPEPDLKKVPFAAKLKELGHDVEILTGYPNYPFGKIYKGYKNRWVTREVINGVDIIRVPLYPNHTKSAIKRAWNYLSFSLSAAIFGIFFVKRPDIIYTYHSPATITIPALWFKLIFRSKIVYDINDYWPDSLRASGMIKNESFLNLIHKLCKFSYRFFDKITVVSQGFVEKLKSDGVPPGKITLIYNWPHPYGYNKSENYIKNKDLFENYISIVYAGNIGSAQQLQIVVDIAARIWEKNNEVRFILVGDGLAKSELKKQVEKRGIKNIFFIDKVPLAELGVFLKNSSFLFLHLKADDLFKITIPSKLFSYLSAGKPIISGVNGEANTIVKNSKSGIVFESENTSDFLNSVEKALELSSVELQQMGANGRKFFKENFSMESGVKKFNDIFLQLNQRS